MAKREKESKFEMGEEPSRAGNVFRILVLVVCFGLIWVMYLIAQPQDLSDIDGYESTESSSRDLEEVMKKAVDGNYSITLTEAEINHMLHTELVAKQRGMLSSDVSIKRVLVRLKKDLAEVIIVRDFFGKEMTVSMYLQIEQTEDADGVSTQIHLHGGDVNQSSPLPNPGGRYGKFTIWQGFLRAVVSDYIKIANVLESEIEFGFERMVRFEIQDKRVILDPRSPTRHVEGEDANF